MSVNEGLRHHPRHCNFCGADAPEGVLVVNGPEASICWPCVGRVMSYVVDETARMRSSLPPAPPPAPPTMPPPAPQEFVLEGEILTPMGGQVP